MDAKNFKPIPLSSMGDNKNSLVNHIRKILIESEKQIRDNFSSLFAIDQNKIGIEYINKNSPSDHVERFEELGKGIVEIGISKEEVDQLYFSVMRLTKTNKCEKVSESHKRIFTSAISPIIDCFITDKDRNRLSDQDDFSPYIGISLLITVKQHQLLLNLNLDQSYCDFIQESYGETSVFSKSKINTLINNIPVDVNLVISNQQIAIKDFFNLKAGDLLLFPLNDSASFVIGNKEIHKADVELVDNSLKTK